MLSTADTEKMQTVVRRYFNKLVNRHMDKVKPLSWVFIIPSSDRLAVTLLNDQHNIQLNLEYTLTLDGLSMCHTITRDLMPITACAETITATHSMKRAFTEKQFVHTLFENHLTNDAISRFIESVLYA